MATIQGTEGADTLIGTSGSDTVDGQGGDDALDGGADGHDTVSGGDGTDLLTIAWGAATGNVTIPSMGGGSSGWTGSYADGGSRSVAFSGIERFDITTGSGNDLLLVGGSGTVRSGAGNDSVWLLTDQLSADGGSGDGDGLSVNLGAATSAIEWDITANRYAGPGGSTRFRNFEYLFDLDTGSGADRIVTGRGALPDNITAGAGDDDITFYNGHDTAYGGTGNDRLTVDWRDNAGTLIYVSDPSGPENLTQLAAGAGRHVRFNGIEQFHLLTGAGTDEIYGSSASEVVDSGGGADLVSGEGGDDRLYGAAGADTLRGGSGGDMLDGGAGVDTLEGGDGDDTITVGYGDSADGGTGSDTLHLTLDGATDVVTIWAADLLGTTPYTLGGGTIVNFEVLGSITGSAQTELVYATAPGQLVFRGGGGSDVVYGATSPIDFDGGADGDLFYASTAADRFDGGDGHDVALYELSPIGVTVYLPTAAGASATSPGGDVLLNVEQLVGSNHEDFLHGGAMADVIDGSQGSDRIYGNDGDDQLTGGWGNDFLYGGAGSDLLVIHDAGDQVFETEANDLDRAFAWVSWTLGAGQDVEHLTLGDVAEALNLTGNELYNSLVGNSFANVLTAGDGHDTLEGKGGGDTLIGGRGDDTYYDVDAADTIVEARGQGEDTVFTASPSYTLAAGVSIEVLRQVSLNATVALDLRGNDEAQTIFGNEGAGQLMGFGGADILHDFNGNDLLDGGAGADRMLGGEGNDTYVVDDVGDVVIDTTGLDAVLASASFTLGNGLDDLTLTGSSDIAGTGNGGANTISGNAGSNELTGEAGDDRLAGNDGQDWLRGGAGGDVESGGSGHDSVWGGTDADTLDGGEGDDTIVGNEGLDTVTYAAAAARVEVDLSFVEQQDTRGAGWDTLIDVENVIGSAFDDRLTGDGVANILVGGLGADELAGGAGNDRFVYAALAQSSAAAADLIADFEAGKDRLDLSAIDADHTIAGNQAFHIGASAGRAGDVVLAFDGAANRTSVSIYVDGDAVADMVVLLAGNHLGLGAADFVL